MCVFHRFVSFGEGCAKNYMADREPLPPTTLSDITQIYLFMYRIIFRYTYSLVRAENRQQAIATNIHFMDFKILGSF